MLDLTELRRLREEATPGPWCVHPNGTSVWEGSGYWTAGKHICNVMGIDEVNTDNANLIAALPELLRLAELGQDAEAYQSIFADAICSQTPSER